MRLILCGCVALLAILGIATAQSNKQQVMIATSGTTAAIVKCGNTGPNNNGSNGGNANFALISNSCIPASNSTVVSCAIFLADAGGHGLACAVYAPGTTPPGAPICQSTGQVSVAGLNTIPLTGCGTLTSGSRYWIAANTDSGSTAYGETSTSIQDLNLMFPGSTYPTFPSGPTSLNGPSGIMFYLNIH